jgi:hypothetical protein
MSGTNTNTNTNTNTTPYTLVPLTAKEEEETKNLHNKKVTLERIAFWALIFGSIFWSLVFIAYILILIYQRYQRTKITTDLKCPKENWGKDNWKTVKNIPETTEACHCYFTKFYNILGCTDSENKITKI